MINDLDMQGWAYLLAPTFQFVNTAGKPLTEGYLEVYIAGTRNKYYCASDFNGTLHPFQIPLDSLGSNIVLADPSQAYDVYAYNRFGSLVMSRYNVSPSNAGGSGVLTITISSNDDTVQVVKDGNNYDLSIADTIARIDDIEDRLDEIGDGSVGYAVAHSELASDGLFELTNDKNKDIDYTGDMHGFRLKPGHVYQLNFNAKFDCNNDTNDLISGKFYLDGDNVVSQEWQFNVDNSFEHQESFNGSTVLVIPEDVSYYDVKLKYSFDDEALDLYLNKISIVDVTSIVSQGASGGGVEYTDGDGIIVDNSNHTINVDMDYINSHLDIDASSILSSAYNYTDARVSQVSGDIVNIISEVTGSLPIPEQVQSDWNQDDDTQVDYIKNKPDLDIYATHDELETTVTNIVSSVSSVLHNEIENIDLSSYATHDEVNTAITNASGDIINYVDNSIDNVTNVIESVSGDLQEQINNIPEQVQSDWDESDVYSPAYIANKPDLSIYATETQLETVSGDIVAMIPEAQVHSDWDEDDSSKPSYIENKPDLSIYATNTELGEVSGNIVSMISDPQIQSDWTQTDNTKVDFIKNKPEEEEVDFEEINLNDYALASAIPSIEGLATVEQVSSVSSVLQNEIDNIPEQVQSDWAETDSQDLAYIKNKPTERQLIPGDNISITASGNNFVISSTGGGEQVNANWDETDPSDPSYIENKPDLSNFATIDDVNAVTSLIPEAQVQSDWTEDDTSEPSYILNKPNELELVAGNNIEIAVSGTNIVISSTASAVTGLDLLYGQFTSNNVSTTATMAKSKGNINVSDGKIQLEQGKSYHITVRGYYQQTNAANSYSPISYVEYITSNTINIDIDRSRTDAQYFELSYDLFNLNSDVDYQVAFSGGAGLVKDLVVEVHSLGGAGTGSSSGGSAIEYDAGYGINISNQVISVDSSIIPNTSTLATKAEVANVSGTIVGMIPDTSSLATKAELNSASANIVGQIPDVSNYATTTDLTNACNNVISMIPEVPESANLIAGNNITITASGNDYVISSTASGGGSVETYTAGNGLNLVGNEFSIDTSVVATQSDLGDVEAEVQVVSSAIPTLPDEEEVDFEELDLSNYALASAIPDVSNLATKGEVANIEADVQIVSAAIPQSSNLIPGDNITITASGDDYVISSTGGGAGTTYTAGDGISITNNEISVDDTVALKSELNIVSGKLPTTETGKFTIQNNVSGGPIEVICPTDVGMQVTNTILDSNAVSGVVGIGTSNVTIVYKSPGYDNDYWNYTNGQIILTVPEDVTGIYSLIAYYSNNSNPLYTSSPYFISNYVVPDTQYYKLAAGTYTINTQANQASSGYGKYITFILAGPNPDATAFAKVTVKGIERHPELGISVDLDRYYLGNTNTTTSNSGTQAVVYTDPTTKKQSVFLPSSMPSSWLSSFVQYVEYGSNYFSPTYSINMQYIAYKQSTNPTRYQYALCTDYDRTNKKMTFISYNESGVAIEKWTVDYNSYYSNVWTTTPISQDMSDYISYSASGVYLPNSKFEIDTEGQAYKLSTANIDVTNNTKLNTYYYCMEPVNNTNWTKGTYEISINPNVSFVNQWESTKTPDNLRIGWFNGSSWSNYTTVNISNNKAIWDNQSDFTYTQSGNDYLLFAFFNGSDRLYGGDESNLPITSIMYDGYIPVEYITETSLASAIADISIPVSGASGISVNNNVISLDNPVGLVAGDNITIEVSGSSAIISSLGGGSTYTAGDGININNDEISIDNTVALKSEIPDVTNLATKAELNAVSAEIPTLPQEEEIDFEELDLSNYALASAIPDTSDMATQTWVGQQGYLTSIPSTYVTDTELSGAVSGLATKSELNAKQDTLTGITDVQVVQSLPASPVATVLYLIPEV